MLQLHRLMWLVLASLTLSVQLVSAQPREVVRDEITLRGTVEAIDRIARTIRIRGDQGNIVTLDVPQSVTRFDQIQIGDVMTVAYYDRVNLRPKPAGEAAVDRSEAAVTTTAPGLLPGATVAVQRVATVTLTGWDPATRTVTYTGPQGASYTRRLLDTTDSSILAGLQVGDRVDVTWTEAVRVSIEAGAASAQVGRPGELAAKPRGVEGSADVLRPMGTGQLVQRPDDQAGRRANTRGRADQPERDELRRCVRPDGPVQARRRLPDQPAQ